MMSNEPPVPPGNQSPYPIQEPPHPQAEPSVEPVTIASVATPVRHVPTPQPAAEKSETKTRRLPLGTIASAAAGAGAIAFGVAALLFPGAGAATRKKGGRRKR